MKFHIDIGGDYIDMELFYRLEKFKLLSKPN
jgi:hypothetical protein